MTKCLILGGNGFIGLHLAKCLVRKDYDVTIFDSFSGGSKLHNLKNIKLIKGNILNENEVNDALNGIDYVFHYVSTTNPVTATKDPIYDIESNVIGSVKLFQMCVKKDIEKIVFSSSGGTIYGEPINLPVKENDLQIPLNPYAIGKLAIEKYLHYFNYTYGINYVILRYSNPYGEGQNPHGMQGVIPIFLNKIKERENPLVFGDGSMIRDYLYIKDAIEATTTVIDTKTKNRIFNIGSGKGTSINELIDIMENITGQKVNPNYKDNYQNYISKIVLDISRIKIEIGWRPKVDLYEGISRTWDWIRRL